MREILTASEAAREIGCTSQKVRERMKRGMWDLGEVIEKEKLGRNAKNEYNIYRHKLEKFIGRELT